MVVFDDFGKDFGASYLVSGRAAGVVAIVFLFVCGRAAGVVVVFFVLLVCPAGAKLARAQFSFARCFGVF